MNQVERVSPTAEQIVASWELIDAHSINSTDAIILQCALSQANQLRRSGNNLVMVSSDQRLLEAARDEGLLTFDPELVSVVRKAFGECGW